MFVLDMLALALFGCLLIACVVSPLIVAAIEDGQPHPAATW